MLANPEDMKLLKRARMRGRGVRRLPGEMNNLEREYAARLKLLAHAGEIEWWAFEGIKLRLADACFYTPDFFVMIGSGTLECHEVKGSHKVNGQLKPFIEDDARVKLKVAAQMFPLRFIMTWKGSDGQWEREEL